MHLWAPQFSLALKVTSYLQELHAHADCMYTDIGRIMDLNDLEYYDNFEMRVIRSTTNPCLRLMNIVHCLKMLHVTCAQWLWSTQSRMAITTEPAAHASSPVQSYSDNNTMIFMPAFVARGAEPELDCARFKSVRLHCVEAHA